jgi:tetratricopeptide (TPR) repeat protein
MRFLVGGGLTIAFLVLAPSVGAQDSRSVDGTAAAEEADVAPRPTSSKQRIAAAKKAFLTATRAYAQGDFETSLASFRKAHQLTDSPDLLYNIATVADRMRHDDEALEAYEGYLEARPDSADAEHVQGRIDALRLAIEAREMEARQAAIEAAARIKAERPLTQYVGPGPGPWITIGAGSATVVSGLILLGLGQRDQKTVESAPPGSSYEEVREAAERGPKRTKAGVALMAVGGAAVVGGIIWQFKGGHEEAIPELSIGPTGFSIRGKF